jgi:hypothetical protein
MQKKRRITGRYVLYQKLPTRIEVRLKRYGTREASANAAELFHPGANSRGEAVMAAAMS